MRKVLPFLFVFVLFVAGCGINSVTAEELANVKAGDILLYRYYRKEDARSWFHARRITRIEGDKIYYNQGLGEATTVRDSRLKEFGKEEEYVLKDDLIKFVDEQGEDKTVIIRIE